jgi:hypothetical protein
MVDTPTPMKSASTEGSGLTLADLGKKIKSEHEQLTSIIKSIVPRAIAIGKDLNTAKKKAGHGNFLKWVALNCAMTNKTAKRYMNLATGEDKLMAKLDELARDAKDKFEMLSNLSLAQAERLSAEPRNNSGDGDNSSDLYDRAEDKLVERLKKFSPDVAEAAVNETIRTLQRTVEVMKRVAQAAA